MTERGSERMDMERSAAVEVSNLSKHYGSVVALNGVDLKVYAGEYFVLLVIVGAIVAHEHDHRVVGLTDLLQIAHQPPIW